MTILLYISIFLFLLICAFMILLVLIQKGRGGGLSSAFGGASGNTAFGSKTGDVLTWVTSVVFGLFLLFAVTLNLLGDYVNRKAVGGPAAPAVTPAGQTAPAPAPTGGAAPGEGTTAPAQGGQAPVEAPAPAPAPAPGQQPAAPAPAQ